jgi:hypothetical protein
VGGYTFMDEEVIGGVDIGIGRGLSIETRVFGSMGDVGVVG